MNYDEIYSKIIYIKNLNNSKIPLLKNFNEFHKYIIAWNKLKDKFNLIYKYKELQIYDSKFFNFTREMKSNLYTKQTYLRNITNDFYYFKENFFSEYRLLYEKLKLVIKKDNIEHQKKLENQRMHDISTSIFSVQESFSRSIFFSIMEPISKEKSEINNKLKYLIDNFYCYLYVKFEQLLHFVCVFEKHTNKTYLYLMKKYKFFINSEIFNNDKKFSKSNNIDDLNKIWIWFKHQDSKYEHFTQEIYKKENIEKYFNEIESVYNRINELINFDKIISDINEYHNEVDGLLNPLGLTGFEND